MEHEQKLGMAKIILITHQKGGVGKSTLTFNLAQNLSEHSKVAILDMDIQGSLAQISNMVESFEITTNQNILTENQELDFVFVDTPPYLSKQLKSLLQAADLILIPTKAGILDLLAIDSTISLIAEQGKETNSMIVLNMTKPNTTLTDDILKSLSTYNIKIAQTKISDLVAFTRSTLLHGVLDNNKAQKQMDSLTKEVLTSLL
ncbi:ParA family protein [Zobellia uliginosa]|uniref:ParA family protein n=1 Tax=Zobellia uliginosa TaxID=143224 RepID=UPI002091DB93|nr:ParA family protein [Zobellia uliginosa]